jgi:hypothetical protein
MHSGRIIPPPDLTDESYCAREPVVADDDVGFYSLVGAFHVHRQSERQERRSRQLYADYLAAVRLDEAPSPRERYKLGCYFGRLVRGGRGEGPRLAIASAPLPFSPARALIYILGYGLLFLDRLIVLRDKGRGLRGWLGRRFSLFLCRLLLDDSVAALELQRSDKSYDYYRCRGGDPPD